MKRSVLFASFTAAAAAAMVTVAGPSSAITSHNSEPAPERTETGAQIVQYDHDNNPSTPDRVRLGCSGTMISADVLLTAAHCVQTTAWPEDSTYYVSLTQDAQGAIEDSIALGGTPEQIAERVGVRGTAHVDPAYPGSQSDVHDMAVITLDSAAASELASRWQFAPAQLPRRGELNQYTSGQLESMTWAVVGYGSQEAENGSGGHTWPGSGTRRKAVMGFSALNPTWIRFAQNESQELGGACYGDSGGPNFVTLDGRRVLAATTITGDVPCKATNVTYRMDTDSARNFLGQFETLP